MAIACLGFRSLNRLGVSLLSLDGMLVHRRLATTRYFPKTRSQSLLRRIWRERIALREVRTFCGFCVLPSIPLNLHSVIMSPQSFIAFKQKISRDWIQQLPVAVLCSSGWREVLWEKCFLPNSRSQPPLNNISPDLQFGVQVTNSCKPTVFPNI